MLRVKVELVPHGIESQSEVIQDIWIENNGEGIPGGPDDGGVGNYNIFAHGETLDHLSMVDYPGMYACGRLEGVPRTHDHRFIVAEQALSIVREHREAEEDAGMHERVPQVVRQFGDASPDDDPNWCPIAPDEKCLDPGGYCTDGDCLAAK